MDAGLLNHHGHSFTYIFKHYIQMGGAELLNFKLRVYEDDSR